MELSRQLPSFIHVTTAIDRLVELTALPLEERGAVHLDGEVGVRMERVTFAYKQGENVLENFSYDFAAGRMTAILGETGAGKSTLLRLMLGLIDPESGRAVIYNKEREKTLSSLTRCNVGYVPQGTPLFDELTAKDNLLLWYDRQDLKKELEHGVLQMLGIQDFLNVRVSKMSGGMKKRLTIGCAMSGKQEVLLLDEPTAALDLACKQKIWDYLDSYCDKGGIVLLVTHDLQEIQHCNTCYLMKEGRLVPYKFDGDVRQLVEQL
jgi:ABC-2 type transport system ATP-binding protein